MAFDGDQRAAPEFRAMLFEDENNIFADAGWTHVIEPQLDDTGQGGAGLKKELCKVEVLGQHHGCVLIRPKHDFRIRGVSRAEFAPMTGSVAVPLKIRNPRDGKTVVNDDGHAG